MKNIINFVAKKIEEEKFFKYEGLQQRGIADFLKNEIIKLFLKDFISLKVNENKKSLEDFSIEFSGKVSLIDIKTTNITTKFSMPNLVAVNKVKCMIENDTIDDLYYLFIKYKIVNNIIEIVKVQVFNILDLNWKNLTISNLGNGQIQVKNMHKSMSKDIGTSKDMNKDRWIRDFYIYLRKFYTYRCLKAFRQWKSVYEVG